MCRLTLASPVATILIVACLIISPTRQSRGETSVSGRPTDDDFLTYCLREEGDIDRGRTLFYSDRLSCANCHAVDGSRGKLGPDLANVGDKLGRRDIIRSIIHPSATIADGYEQTLIETTSGRVFTGLIQHASPDWCELVGLDAQPVRIAMADIEERQALAISFMPQGLHATLNCEELNDVVEYLVSLKQPQSAELVGQGMPREIQALQHGIDFVPLIPDSLQFSGPVWAAAVPDASQCWLVLEHATKKIWYLAPHAADERLRKTEFLDLGPSPRAEGRLACLAFHPDFERNRKYYVYDRDSSQPQLYIVISERTASADGRTDSGARPREILRVAQSTLVHFGGWMAFGPDGYLYVSFGDSGPQEDPLGNAQNRSLLLGKIVRIDVNHEEHGKAYRIPADNPFVASNTYPPEVWASGFRAPWRCSFDRQTHELWVGDVGQDRYEEVGIVRRGENHGWNVFEGFLPFSNQYRRADEAYTTPIFAYGRRYGPSITGGYVVRSERPTPLEGKYVCGDFESRRVFALTCNDRQLRQCQQIGVAPQRIVSFAEDPSGELFIVGFEGMIYRIDATRLQWQE